MKRNTLIITLLFTLLAGNGIFGVIVRTNMDFSTYDQNVKLQYSEPAESYISNVDGVPKAIIGYTDFTLSNWFVEFNGSSDMMQTRVFSYCKTVNSVRFGEVLGVRVRFPNWPNNGLALIKPPFPIQVYDTNGSFINTANGVLPNVSELKYIAVWVNGRNFNYQLAIRFRDRDGKIMEYYLGHLQFDGWRKLVWMNPFYTERAEAKSLKRMPLYPKDVPYIVFDSFVIYRPGSEQGGDFVTYLKSIEIGYSPYIIDNEVMDDIKDEEVWQIITEESRRKADIENRRFAEQLYLQQQERTRLKKMQ